MIWQRPMVALLFATGTCSLATPAVCAQEAADPILERYMQALEAKRLAPQSAASLDEMGPMLDAARSFALTGRDDEALSLLLDIVEGPRFRDFAALDDFHAAELMLASALTERFALDSAQRVVERILARGPDVSAFSPAYRRAVDIALARGDLDRSAARLATFHREQLPEDCQNELAYLEARAAYERGDLARATTKLNAVTKKSRFYASAQYLLGALAARSRKFREAEARFCAITEASRNDEYTFFVDGRFFPIRDLAQLALGRVAHETGRANDAFYYYFQVPNDSDKLSEAMFEAAWASYEGDDYDAALDSLDQLEARFPRSAFLAEAAVLRGYVHLSRCEFAEAERHLTRFERQFTGVLRQIDATIDSASRRLGVYEDLVAREATRRAQREAGRDGTPTPDSLLLSLLRADPDFFRLHAEIRSLDAELAKTGNVDDELVALAQRLGSAEAPKAREGGAQTPAQELEGLQEEIGTLEGAVNALSVDIGRLARVASSSEELTALRQQRRELDRELGRAKQELDEAVSKRALTVAPPDATDVIELLQQDRAYVNGLRAQAQLVRSQLVAHADRALLRALRELRTRLASELRRARIGRIDAVMGSKHQVELQIESLAAGRFPPELADVLRMQSLLRDDEEYWPFEGEDWPDEFLERYPDEETDP